jgi:hypothetical protein
VRVSVEVSAAVEGARSVEVRMDETGETIAQGEMGSLPDSPWVEPTSPSEETAQLIAAGIEAPLGRIGAGEPQSGDVRSVGRYLFDSLLGDSAWRAISAAIPSNGGAVIELALSWPAGERALHRLPWEAMHDGSDFLGVHPQVPVALTRVVNDADGVDCPGSISAPARVLFAIGAKLNDPRIRPGAEIIGLLRDAERGSGAINALIADQVSLSRLTADCERFRPDVVHFVSHGQLRADGRPVIKLHADEEDDDGWVGAEALLGALRAGQGLPALVVLTGCETAAEGEHMDSLAAELVRGGVPMVIGMAGKISDPVCRLFSRKFGEALNSGEPLVEALTHGRRAGLQRQSGGAADDHAWTLPTIYVAPSVPPGHSLVDVSGSTAILTRFVNSGLLSEPVFCGRRRLARNFDRLLNQTDPLNVLVSYAESDESLGKTRLQHEFAGRAIRAGHVFVKIDDDGGDSTWLPSTPLGLAIVMLEEIAKTRGLYRLGLPTASLLLRQLKETCGAEITFSAGEEHENKMAFATFLSECKTWEKENTVPCPWLRPALVGDLSRLIDEARESEDPSIGPESRIVVILGGVGSWGDAADLLFDELLDQFGLGEQDEQIPVFATCSFAETADQVLRAARDEGHGYPWILHEKLKPFEDGEDTLAYQWVLLHPRPIFPELSNQVYTPKPEGSGHSEEWQEKFKKYIGGVPDMLSDEMFYVMADILLEAADDEDLLASYLGERR